MHVRDEGGGHCADTILYTIQGRAAENWSLNSIVGEEGGGTGCVELLQRARGHTPWNCGNTQNNNKNKRKKRKWICP